MKVYLDKDVYTAFVERINYVFDEFELVYFSVSGGKDSSVMVQLANEIAKERNRQFDVFYVDYEAQYTETINHLYDLKKLSQIRDFYHLCLPFNSHNASSIFQPHWQPWNQKEKDKWVREMPEDCINEFNHPFGNLFVDGEEVETFMTKFPLWLMKKHNTDKVACFVGIRADESLNRFRAIAFGKTLYKNNNWSTDIGKNIFNFYPMYDWKTQDIWTSVSKFNLLYNEVYEMLYKNGVSIHDQRICQPYGSDQRVSLNQWAALEPETWHKVVNRVSGANFGNIYCKTSLLGHNGTQKPNHLSWQEYTVFLLESIGMYSKDLMNHYVRKIKIFFDFYEKNESIKIEDISDELTKKQITEKYGERTTGKWIHWKRIAKAIEKNDFACKSLSYGLTKKDKETMIILKEQFGKTLGLEHYKDKEMRNLSKEINYEKTN
jgi:predicted phosphoadenosine phosphosulfate sulfurtransferase